LLNLVSSPNLLNLVSSPNLLNLVSSPNLLNLVSSPNLLNLVSSPNLLNLVSTSLLDRIFQSSLTGLGSLGYVSTQSLYSSVARWADYQATSAVSLQSSNARIINPFPYDSATNTSYPMKLQTPELQIYDSNNGPGFVSLGSLSLTTSTGNETYTLGLNSFLTGSVSSLGIVYVKDNNLQTGSLYLSSLYFGNFGGTTSGQLTTDNTATNLYWKGTQLNGGGGGGITENNLVSTVVGLGSAGYISTPGGGGGITTEQLISTIEKWARYPAISSIVFSTNADTNQIVSPGSTFLQLVTDLSVLVTTSTTIDGITPFRGVNASQYGIADQINLGTLAGFNYTYTLIGGQNYTGSISTPTFTNADGSLGSLYISSVFLAAQGGASVGTAGELRTDETATKLFYSTNQLANVKVNVVFSTLDAGAVDPQLYSYDIGKYFLFSTTTGGLAVNLPSVENGWNAVIKNLEGSTETLKVNAISQVALAPGVVTTVVCDGLSFYSL